MPLTLVLALSCLSTAECAETPSAPETITISGHGQTVFALRSADRVHLAVYAQGNLSSDLKTTQHDDGGWTIAGQISHTPPNGDAQQYVLKHSSTSPDEISLNGKAFPIPAPPAPSADADDALLGPWFVLTSYGRAVPTGRYFTLPEAADFDPTTNYSHAWYFQRDLHSAEVQRNSLEMDDLEGWVLAWDQQHCIQHSDNARVAKVRVYADGRVVMNQGHRHALVEGRILQADVETLIAAVLELDGVQKVPSTKADDSGFKIFPRALGGGLWDQYQDLLTIQQGEMRHVLRVVHPGRDDRIGNVPAGWDAVADALHGIIRSTQAAELR